MANVLTPFLKIMFAALANVAREQTGAIRSCTRGVGLEGASINDSIKVPIVPTVSASNLVEGVAPPDSGDFTGDSISMQLTKRRTVWIRFTGEDVKQLRNSGTYDEVMRQRFEQGVRTLANEMEADLCLESRKLSRAYGLAGTAPFGTAARMTEVAHLRKILQDNGAPMDDLHLILDTTAAAELRDKHSELFKVNEAGEAAFLREGALGKLSGFMLHESAGIAAHTKGTGAGYQSDLIAGYGIGDRTIHVDTGTGAIVAGDVVTFAGDANKYIVETGFAGDGDGDIVLARPGLRAALANDVAMTVGNDFTANFAIHRSAIALGVRPPAVPELGDLATDREVLQDAVTGLPMEFAYYPQYGQGAVRIAAVWGVATPNPHLGAVLLG